MSSYISEAGPFLPMDSVGFIGAGNMAYALVKGFMASGKVKSIRRRAKEFEALGAVFVPRSVDVVQQCKVVFIAVKPDKVCGVLKELSPHFDKSHLVISVVAGVAIPVLEGCLTSPGVRVVRVMPNTPCLIGAAAAAYSLGTHATHEDASNVESLMSTCGTICNVPDEKMDAVTGLSGSGPAYVYLFIEALADGGVRAGLPRDVALKLASQTVMGAGKMVAEGAGHPGVLKDAVCSPGGTTIAGVHALETRGFRGTAMEAVAAAAGRSKELREAANKS